MFGSLSYRHPSFYLFHDLIFGFQGHPFIHIPPLFTVYSILEYVLTIRGTPQLLALFGWGFGSFLAKLATNRIGSSAVFWDMVGYAASALVYAVLVYKPAVLLAGDKIGMWLAIGAGVTGGIGGVAFYLLMTMKDASIVAPLTAVYPALTAILAFIFLHEQLTFVRVVGIILATIAVILLSL